MNVNDPVSVQRGKHFYHGTLLKINTAPQKRHMGRGKFDMVEVVVSYEVEVIVSGLAGETTTRATVPPGAVRRI